MRVTSRGRVTIPKDVRHARGIEPVSEVRIELDHEGAVRIPGPPISSSPVDETQGGPTAGPDAA